MSQVKGVSLTTLKFSTFKIVIRPLFYDLSPGHLNFEVGFKMAAWQPFLWFEIHSFGVLGL